MHRRRRARPKATAPLGEPTPKADRRDGQAMNTGWLVLAFPRYAITYSHSIVAGGLEEMS